MIRNQSLSIKTLNNFKYLVLVIHFFIHTSNHVLFWSLYWLHQEHVFNYIWLQNKTIAYVIKIKYWIFPIFFIHISITKIINWLIFYHLIILCKITISKVNKVLILYKIIIRMTEINLLNLKIINYPHKNKYLMVKIPININCILLKVKKS